MIKSTMFLEEALKDQQRKGELRESQEGERSMGKIVAAFNGVKGSQVLSETDGWLFMVLLKLVRSDNGKFHSDDYSDAASYASLLGEAASRVDDEKNQRKAVTTTGFALTGFGPTTQAMPYRCKDAN